MEQGIVVHAKSLHHISIIERDLKEVDITSTDNDFGLYLHSIISTVTNRSNDSRDFKFRSDTTEVRSMVDELIKNSSTESFGNIADRLLEEEIAAQERHGHLTNLQEGSLLQAYVSVEEAPYYVIIKVDHLDFLDEDDLQKRVGLPFEEHVLKTCVIEIDGQTIKDEVKVSDTLRQISKYWWQHFLELIEITSDEKNTKSAFQSIDTHLGRRLKNYYPSDYTFIRNSLISYFRTNSGYNHQEMVSQVIGDYEPVDEELPLDNLRETMLELAENRSFDRSFNIMQDAIKARFSRTIPLDNKIDLKLKEDIENLRGRKIRSDITPDGKKVIVIESDHGYDLFRTETDD